MQVQLIARGEPEEGPYLGGDDESTLLSQDHRGIHIAIVPRYAHECHDAFSHIAWTRPSAGSLTLLWVYVSAQDVGGLVGVILAGGHVEGQP